MFAKKIGIDLGSSTVQICIRGEGLVVDEPAVAALDRRGHIRAAGRQAYELLERAPEGIRVVQPIREGRIREPEVCEELLGLLIGRAQGRHRFFRPEVMICVPSSASGIERRALAAAAIAAGARQAWLIEAPLAAALGAGLPISDPRPRAVCDLGGGKVETAVIAQSGLVAAMVVPVGGDHLDLAIAEHLRSACGLLVGHRVAEEAKLEAGAAVAGLELRCEVAGLDAGSRRPRIQVVSSDELLEAMRDRLADVAAGARQALEQTPPGHRAEVRRQGLLLTGGGAALRGIDRYLAAELDLPVRIAHQPRTCAALGTQRALGEFEVVQRRQLYLT